LSKFPDRFTPSNTPSNARHQFEGVARSDAPVSLGLFEPPIRKSQVLLRSVLPHHSPHHATHLGVMGYEVQIGLKMLTFLNVALQGGGRNYKTVFKKEVHAEDFLEGGLFNF
jgi:hypothetical protein